MTPDLAATLLNLVLRLFVGFAAVWLFFVTSKLTFGFSFRAEIQKGNKAAAIFWAGVAVMVGLVAALTRDP